MKKFVFALAASALIALPASVQAAPCKDAKGKFIKCPTTAAVKPAAKPMAAPAAKPLAAKPAAAKGKAVRCRDAKGRFTKCPK